MHTPPRTLLKRPGTQSSIVQTVSQSSYNCEYGVAEVVSELMNASITFHKLHLKVQGVGAYSAHKALNDLYTALPEHADNLAEGYQGASCCILAYNEIAPKIVNDVEGATAYIQYLKDMITSLQSNMPYSEIINELDTVKSTLNSAAYKLMFLK